MRPIQPILIAALTASLVVAQGPGPGPGPGGQSGDGIWRRNAYYGEGLSFDNCLGHQPGNGQYHYHAVPVCLRAELNDNITVVRTGRTGPVYQELQSGWHHSPILGWALDGYPIYGPYGYSNPNDATSPIKRIVSGYTLRNITTRTSLPSWSLPNHSGISQNLSSSQYGPAVSTQYPLGRYLEDYDYTAAGDLDQYNGRFAVTPDFPKGTYAYYTPVDANGVPQFPFIIAGQFYGVASGSFPTSTPAGTTTYVNGGTITGSSTSATVTSWSTKYATQNASIVSGFDPSAGLQTTWPETNTIGVTTSGSVTTPTKAEIQGVSYTSTSAYITTNGLAGYQMGPWFSANMTGNVFSNFPSGGSTTMQIPLSPSPASSLANTSGGEQGMWVNGVAVFNFIDGASYSNAQAQDVGGGIAPALLAATYSSASYEQGPLPPNSFVTATPLFFTTFASNATVTVTDSAGKSSSAQISYASPSQINFLMPSGLASGAGTVTISAGGNSIPSKINIQPIYPNLFMANANGLAAANVYRNHAGTLTIENDYTLNGSTVTARPIPMSGDTITLVLYGSGMGSATSATATIGGVTASVAYAGPQGTYTGLDQYNVTVPASLAGAGSVNVIVTVAGKPSNPVNVTFQ